MRARSNRVESSRGIGYGFTMTDTSTVKRNDIAKEDEDDNVEADTLEVAPPPPPLPMLERQAHHTPPGAFAMSLGATPQDVSGSMVLPSPRRGGGGARRCRTNSCDTHATMSLEDEEDDSDDDYVLQTMRMHHVPIAELVLTTESSMVSSLGPGGSFTNNNNNNSPLYDVEIAQEVYGGQVIPSNLAMPTLSSEARTTGQVWRRALLLAVGMTLLLVAVVGTAKAVRQSSSNDTSSTLPPEVTSSKSNPTTNNTTTAVSPPEDETSSVKYLTTPPIIRCQEDNTTEASHDSLVVCDVAETIKNNLNIPLNETRGSGPTWDIVCPDGRTILVNDRVRVGICKFLAKGNVASLSEAAAAATNDTETPSFPLLQTLLQQRGSGSP
jgi:hypothetical protein